MIQKVLQLRRKNGNFSLKMKKKIVIWEKHACQNMVAMETSKLTDKGSDVKMFPDKF